MVYKEEINNYIPNNNTIVDVYQVGNILEVKGIERKCSNLSDFKKLNNHQSINKSTGEIIEHKNNDNCIDDRNMNNSYNELRRLIINNFSGCCGLHIVLTYKYEMRDVNQLSIDFKNFWKRFRYKYKGCEYIAVKEPHSNGVWHMHVLIKSNNQKFLYVDSKKLENIWGNGFVKVERINNAEKLASYLTVLKKNVPEKDIEVNDNLSKKQKLLKYYPRNVRLFNYSKGIKKPLRKTMTFGTLMRSMGGVIPEYSKTLSIQYNDGENIYEVNKIHYLKFRRK